MNNLIAFASLVAAIIFYLIGAGFLIWGSYLQKRKTKQLTSKVDKSVEDVGIDVPADLKAFAYREALSNTLPEHEKKFRMAIWLFLTSFSFIAIAFALFEY